MHTTLLTFLYLTAFSYLMGLIFIFADGMAIYKSKSDKGIAVAWRVIMLIFTVVLITWIHVAG
jgi:hypothetical protein